MTKKRSLNNLLYASEAELDSLEKALDTISKSKIGQRLLNDAKENGTTIEIVAGIRCYGSFDELTNSLLLNARLDPGHMVGTLAHELRHSQQFQKGILLDAGLDLPLNYLHNQAVIEADACATACAVCWDLKEQGFEKPLESLREKDPHIVNPFQNQAVTGGLENGAAQKAAFYGWFTSYSTRDAYDNLYIKMRDQQVRKMNREQEKNACERVVPVQDIINSICKTADDKPYLGKEAEQFFKSEDMQTISYQPFCNVFSQVYFKYGFDYKRGENAIMKEEFGVCPRPHASYMPPAIVPELVVPKTLQERQAQAVEKIKAVKKRRKPISQVVIQEKLKAKKTF